MRQAFCWWCLQGKLPDRELLKTAADIGYQGVEFLPDELWSAAKEAGLAIATMGAHGTIGEGLNNRANHERIVNEVRSNLDRAVQHGVKTLIGFSGNRRPGLSDADGLAITIEGLRQLAPLLDQAGVDLVIELLNSKDHKDYMCDRTAWGVAVCEAVNSPRVKLLYDIFHMQRMEGDLIATIRQHHRHFGHYHTAGNPGRNELDDLQEIHYPAVFAAIRETGYQGYVGHEFLPKGDVKTALQQAFELAR